MRFSFAITLVLAVLFAPFAASAQSSLKPASLKVDGLNFESEVAAVYLGDFANARMEPTSNAYSFLLREYINSFARLCPRALPANRVEIMGSRCVAETVTRNGFGVEVSRSCSQYESYGTGRFADPALLKISDDLQARQSRAILGSIIPQRGVDPTASTRRMTDVALAAKGDMDVLLGQNACSSAALKRFQANLQRFGTGLSPLRLAGGATLASTRGGGGAYVPSNYGKMIDALIRENSRGWMLNRYASGSVSGVSVGGRDAQGRPAQISARYRFNQLGTPTNGTVRLTFRDGRPACLFFFDAPQTCRVPSPGVVTAYEKGEFR